MNKGLGKGKETRSDIVSFGVNSPGNPRSILRNHSPEDQHISEEKNEKIGTPPITDNDWRLNGVVGDNLKCR